MKTVKKTGMLALTKGAKVRLGLIFTLLAGFCYWSWTMLTGSEDQISQQSDLLEAVYQQGNYIETGLWTIIALGFGVTAIKANPRQQRRYYVAMITFFCFGLSDIVEVQTGGWWKPWWLFAWKSLCILVMVMLLVAHLRDRPTV